MKPKTITKKILFSIFIILDIALIIFLYIRGNKAQSTSNTTTTVSEATVSTKTITKELTASGQIESAVTEDLSLSTSKYFKNMCVEDDEYVAKGDNILEYTNGTYLTAPYNLVVSSYTVPETGSICTSTNSVKVESLDDIYMTLSVDESELSSVKVGQTASITINANEDEKYTGTVTKIDEIGTYAASGSSFTAKISIANDGNIKIGMSASATLTLDKKENVLAIPIQAVQTKDNQKYVVVLNDDKSTKDVNITTGISDDSYVEVTSGLTSGETIQMTTTTAQSSGTSSSKTANGMLGITGGRSMQGSSTSESGYSNRRTTNN